MIIAKKEAEQRLKSLPGWQLKKSVITKEFVFKDFKEAFRFMTSSAKIAEKMQHHPEWTNNYNKVAVWLTTHNPQGLTELDFELARQMNELYG